MATFHAILIGINAYPKPYSSLTGCENDVRSLATFLQERVAFELKITQLLSQQATKSAVVAVLKDLAAHVGPSDTVLFYYSGHGAQEASDPVWHRSENDKALETLCCWNDTGNGLAQLADKELRYLLRPICERAGHVLTLFDSCHSGDVTRSGGQEVTAVRNLLDREPLPAREWSQFVFSDTLSPAQVQAAGSLNEVLPIGRHVRLAACRDHQTAQEAVGIGGVFTSSLLAALKGASEIPSYLDLVRRIQILIGGSQYTQTPEVAFEGGADASLAFLGKAMPSRPLKATLVYHGKSFQWRLNRGALDGLDMSNPALSVTLENGKALKVVQVMPSESVMEFPAEMVLDLTQQYPVQLVGAFSLPLFVYCPYDTLRTQLADDFLAAINVQLVKGVELAHYQIVVSDGNTLLQKQVVIHSVAADGKQAERAKWITVGTEAQSADPAVLRQSLAKVARWERLRRFANPALAMSNGKPISLNLEMHTGGWDNPPIPPQGEEPLFLLTPAALNTDYGVRISITNHFKQLMHCAIIYLGDKYEIHPNMLGQAVQRVEYGGSASVLEGAPVNFRLEPDSRTVQHNLPFQSLYLLVVASTSPFNVAQLAQEQILDRGHKDVGDPMRGHDSSTWETWGARCYELRLINPAYRVGMA